VHTACNVMTERLMSLTDRTADCRGNRTASCDITVRLNSTCWYESITQQYLERCSIKNANNYMFRPIAAIIRLSSKWMYSHLYVWYGYVTMVRSHHLWWLLYAIVKCQGEGICDVRYPGVCSWNVCSLLSYVSL